jgi:hypothetical protein
MFLLSFNQSGMVSFSSSICNYNLNKDRSFPCYDDDSIQQKTNITSNTQTFVHYLVKHTLHWTWDTKVHKDTPIVLIIV